MEDLGYETHNAILNLGSMWIFANIYFLRVIIYLVLKAVKRYSREGRFKFKILEYEKLNLFFGSFLALLIEPYMEWLISGWLNFKFPLHESSGE